MKPLVDVEDLHFAYEAGPVLDGVSLQVEEGEILGVIGPNSVGKTTLLRLLSRVLVPQAGTVRLEGVDLARLRRLEISRRVAVVTQDVMLAFPFTVREFVLMGRYPHRSRHFFEDAEDLAAADAAIRSVGLDDVTEKLVHALSGGERQRALVARALAQQPKLLLMDEPNAHLDLHHQVELAQLIRRLNREEGTTVVLVSHDLNLAAEISDRLLLMAGGRVARIGKPIEVLDPSLIEAVYGCRVRIGPSASSGRPRVQVEWLEPYSEGGMTQEDRARGAGVAKPGRPR